MNLLGITLVLMLVPLGGCATLSAPVKAGHTYAVLWPGVKDLVVIEEVKGPLAVCRSVEDPGEEWVCNFATAIWWREVIMRPAVTPGQPAETLRATP